MAVAKDEIFIDWIFDSSSFDPFISHNIDSYSIGIWFSQDLFEW